MDNLGDQGQELKRARPELFQKQKVGKAPQVAFVGEREHGAEAPEIDVFLAHVVMLRQTEMPCFLQSFFRIFARDFQECCLRRLGLKIDQIHDRALIRPDDRRMRFGDEVAH